MQNNTYWRFKQQQFRTLKISRNLDKTEIASSHPLVVFYTDDKVYYLTAKTWRNQIPQDKDLDVYFKNGSIDHGRGEIINCSSINIMNRKEFESIFEPMKYPNGESISSDKYAEIINKLNENIQDGNIAFNECYLSKDRNNKIIVDWKDKVNTSEIKDLKENINAISLLDKNELQDFLNGNDKILDNKKNVLKDKPPKSLCSNEMKPNAGKLFP
ncbi:Mbov_0400 family ICE element protein, partial [Mycoplasma zalophidermidis]|uniref:Mbov_0400 family ICE element protein n=1 Tax=Mycoplasma zalophidermidis TaxID=398174 RepID=UPI0035A397B8|nr:hypothetical protein [Mycoplasma zalophidermidis]